MERGLAGRARRARRARWERRRARRARRMGRAIMIVSFSISDDSFLLGRGDMSTVGPATLFLCYFICLYSLFLCSGGNGGKETGALWLGKSNQGKNVNRISLNAVGV